MNKTIYDRDEALQACIKYFNNDTLAAGVFLNKYALRNKAGDLLEETPDHMHGRIASEFARIEKKYPNSIEYVDIFNAMDRFRYIIPQGSPMFGIGNNEQLVSVGNCFVVEPPEDSYASILWRDELLVQIMKRRGGCGIDISKLRPRMAYVNNAARSSSGATSFAERFSKTTQEVAQDGRRGALLISMDCRHPDLLDFIKIKRDHTKVTGANISIKWNNDFLNAVKERKTYTLRFPVDVPVEEAQYTTEVDAYEIWEEFVQSNWESAEPGCLFWDTIINQSISDCYHDFGFATVSTNPCVVGSTLIATADGRNAVTIKQLAEEGNDIPVYCLDNDGHTKIRMMRNPRITGYDKKIYEVTLDDGSKVKCTGNHKFILRDGSHITADSLKVGDSLNIKSKWKTTWKEIFGDKCNSKSTEYWMTQTGKTNKFEHTLVYENLNGVDIDKGFILHHRDINSLNNNIDNLELMTKDNHDKLHDISGEKNPMVYWYKNASIEEKERYHINMSKATSGSKNGNYSGWTNKEIENEMYKLGKQLCRYVTIKAWQKHAKNNGMPQSFSNYRGSLKEMLYDVNRSLGYDIVKDDYIHNREYAKFIKIVKDTDLDVRFIDGKIRVYHECEDCGIELVREWSKRERVLCRSCSAKRSLLLANKENIDRYNRESNDKLIIAIDCFIKYVDENNKIPTKQDFISLINEKNIIDFRSFRCYSYKEFLNNIHEMYNVEINSKIKNSTYLSKKAKELKNNGLCYNHKVISVEIVGRETVYNGTVDEYHNFGIVLDKKITNSGRDKYEFIFTPQCGEITLSSNGACILMVVNLASFVKDMFTKDAKYDFKLFEKYVRMGVRLIDDMIDLEIEKCDTILTKIRTDYEDDPATYARELNLWEKIRENYINGRRTGLGITGLGDAIAFMNLKYGSEEGLEFVAEVFSNFQRYSYSENAKLAKERGAFPIWNWDLEKDSHYIKILPKSIRDDIQANGRRNIALNTCAPTGSVSILTQTSSGIEPVYKRVYERQRKMAQDDHERGTKADRIDSDGVEWISFDVEHHGYRKWLDMFPRRNPENSPYAKSEADELDPNFRVDMQGIIQKFIDHSISSTCNLPQSIKPEEVSDLYLRAWEKGCKGFTIFRDGSREGVLSSGKKKREEGEIIETHAPKRPKILECEIHKSNVKNTKWIFFVGIHKGKPYEIFGGSRESIEIPNKYKTGWITKNGRVNGRRQYDLILGSFDDEDDQLIIKDIASQFCPDVGSYTRIIATMLRHGVPIKFVCEQLKKDDKECSMFSFESVAARILKKFIKDGEESGDMCECGYKFIYKDGCKTCINCGNGFCS